MCSVTGQPPPLPPSPFPDDLVDRCRTGFVSAGARTARAALEVHATHLRVVTPAVRGISSYARRMSVDDLVLSFEQISAIRSIGLMTSIVELPRSAAVAFTGPQVRQTLAAVGSAVPLEARRFRPFFVGFWLSEHRNGRVADARPLP